VDRCFEQAVAGRRAEGQRGLRRCQWRWIKPNTLCLVLVDESQPQDGMTL
jgi:hypothetical protein